MAYLITETIYDILGNQHTVVTGVRAEEPALDVITEADQFLPEGEFKEKCRRIALQQYEMAMQDPTLSESDKTAFWHRYLALW